MVFAPRVGSSPLTRGKRSASARRWSASRLIPAHAGKTAATWPTPPDAAAHPRSRGENDDLFSLVIGDRGSSPLTRGKPSTVRASPSPPGLIPAHAGKTLAYKRKHTFHEAHPRSRGENYDSDCPAHWGGGSSPLTRGKHVPGVRGPRLRRLIPAHAGKTKRNYKNNSLCKAHPRSRGENQLSSLTAGTVMGSSPLTRGKLPGGGPGSRGRRLIPAHAGKTLYASSLLGPAEAHPRSRGENAASTWGGNEFPGSSPLTRGKPVL